MKKKENKKSVRTFIIAVIVGVLLLFVLALIKQNPQDVSQQYLTYTSQDLKISFEYPRDWHVDEKDRSILIVSYATRIGKGSTPNKNQIKMFINSASLCQKSLDEDVLLGGCGEGENTKNEILSKDIKKAPSGLFIIYKIKYPTGQMDTFYYLQHYDTILQISKQPDPSQFEKEFEDIINSIRFL
ncbi:MAG: hypothetical protein AAB600_01595 [Patescibacteria group bacterium]